MNNTFAAIWSANGWDSFAVMITIWVLVYYQLKFFFMYFRRKLSIAFLTIVSPLITITYAMDAVKDGKTQIYNTWLKEMVFNIFIQIIHALIYAVFVISAGEIAKQVPIMGAILFMSLSRAVKVVRTTMKLSSDITKSESLFKRLQKKSLFRK